MEERVQNTPSTQQRPVKSTKLPDPPIFEGKDGQSFDDWITKIRTKLDTNSDHYNTELLRMGYIQGLVGDKAMKHLATRLRHTSTNRFKTGEEMLVTLERVYVDPNRKITAITEFQKLYQKNSTFQKFWAEFQRLTAEIDMTEETLLVEFRNRISLELQSAIVAEIQVTSVQELAEKCLIID